MKLSKSSVMIYCWCTQWSLEPDQREVDGENAERPATVPFLLQLASLSPTLLRALTTDVLHTCKFIYLIYQFA